MRIEPFSKSMAAAGTSTHHSGAERRRHQCGGSGDAYRERLDDDGVRTLTSAEQVGLDTAPASLAVRLQLPGCFVCGFMEPVGFIGVDQHAAGRFPRGVSELSVLRGASLGLPSVDRASSLLAAYCIGKFMPGAMCSFQRFIQCFLRLCLPGEVLGSTRHLKRSGLIYGSSCCEFT